MSTQSTGSTTGSVVVIAGRRTFASGLASGIDTAALIDAAYKQKLAEATKLTDKITVNSKKITSLTDLKSLAGNIQTSLAGLKRKYSVLDSSSTFELKSGTLSTSTTGANPGSFMSVAIEDTAVEGNYEIEVVQLAKAQKIRSAANTDPTAALSLTGSFDISSGTGTASAVNVTAGMSLNDVADAINAVSDTSKVVASVLKVSSTEYKMILSSSETNQQITSTVTSGTDILQSLGLTDGVGGFPDEVQPAQPAEIMLDGMLIQRDTNTVDDLITGVEINLLSPSAGVKVDLKIGKDTESLKTDILNFVDAFNTFRDLVIANQRNPDGSDKETSILVSEFQLRNINDTVMRLIGANYGNGGTDMSNLRELGITLDKTNKFTVDEAKLDTALTTKYDQVKNIFQSQVVNPNAEFALIKNEGKQAGTMTINFDITYSGGAVTGVIANGDAAAFDINGTSISGKAGTIYEGLTFGYAGTTNTTFTFSLTQGLAELMNGTLESFTDDLTGSLQEQIDNISNQNSDLQSKADRIEERAEDFRENLIDRYAAFERQISAANSILRQLRAILGNTDENN